MDEDSNFQGFGPSQVSGAAEVIPPRSLVDFSVFVYHACLYRVTLGQTAGDGGCKNTSEDERKKKQRHNRMFSPEENRLAEAVGGMPHAMV